MEPQELPQQYYLVVDEKSTGPVTFEELVQHPALTPETLVWKPGIDNWQPAKSFPELAAMFASRQQPPQYHNPYKGDQEPFKERQDPYQGQQDPYQGPRDNYQGPREENNRFAGNPQYRQDHTYHDRDRYYNRHYQNGYRPAFHTNWLPWAIVATVVGFFTSCIGAIFGIIGIVQANKANSLYAQGLEPEADAANANAKTMTIIGLIFAGLGILVIFWFGNIFSGFTPGIGY